MESKSSDQVANMLKCIAHPVKLDIIQLLNDHEQLTVSEIQTYLDCNCEQSMLSHHLIKMKDRKVLSSLKVGKFIYYKLENKKIVTLIDLMYQL